MKKAHSWFKELSNVSKVTVVSVASVLLLGTMGALAQPGTPSQSTSPTINTPIPVKVAPSPVKETKSITTTEVIPFSSSTVEDASLNQGVTQTTIQGVNGERLHYYDVVYTNGIETSRQEVKSEVTKAPINEVVTKGTKVASPVPSCTNGTYVNSYGDTVCSPYSSPSAPSGASAQCADGTYSFSQTRRGTCSHHGGVAVWY